jgi:hypothetical protein
MPTGITRLTVETIDGVLENVFEQGATAIDLRSVRFVDPYALLLLELLVREMAEQQSAFRIEWPEAPTVRRWMNAMGFVVTGVGATPAIVPSTRDARSALQPITPITDEGGIGRVVDGFHRRLAERYPLTESSRRTLTAMMIELFQNIPHHSNATGEIADPHGIAAMQDYEDSIFLAIADKGVGLRGSLGLRPGYDEITDSQALDAILRDGLSRFADAGRGGELQRIVGVVRSWDGAFALRSGSALLYFDERGGDIYDVPQFSGVQLAIRLPLRLFDAGMVDP